MSRIRTVKPEWMEDEGLLRAGADARVLSICLILLADDYGRGRFIPEVLAGQCFPFAAQDGSRESSRVFREAFESLSAMGFARVYEVRGQRYFEISNWSKHQKVDKPGKPRVPEPLGDTRESSRESRESLAPDHDHDHDLKTRSEAARDDDAPLPIRRPMPPPEPLEQRVEIEFKKRFQLTAKVMPNEKAVSLAARDLAHWIRGTAELRAMTERDVLSKLLDGFFASARASEKGFPPSFLAQNAAEYFEPQKRKDAPAPGNSAALGAVLKQLAAAREKAERAGPDSWERTQAQNEIADLEGRANRLRAS